MKRLSKLATFLFATHRAKSLACLGALLALYWFCLPKPLFTDPTCMVLEARDGSLLGARIATDGQWRFPYNPDFPEKFAAALVEFEDRRFFQHPGFDPAALARALSQNIRNQRVVSGGSTLSMQVIRLARKGKSRNVFQKIIEIILATRLEIRCSKQEILALYASNAPFGGNVVGLDAASWRYFGKNAAALSWSEAATLAVLPNSPALIHPGRNRQTLLDKRNRLLKRLRESGEIDQLTFELAAEEPLPEKPHPLPRLAPHLLERAFAEHFKGKKSADTKLRTTLDLVLQSQVSALAQRRSQILKSNEIHNLAVLVLDVESGDVLAYVGNAPGAGKEHGEEVDVVKAPRSTGSILKPLLYAAALQEGQILPGSLLPDIPTTLHGYRPENFMETYDGMVPADKAVARSLNVPFVRMLMTFGLEKFHFQLKKLGITSLGKPASHYGLTLVLGGAEGTLWDITNVYACMGRTLGHFYPNSGAYSAGDFRPANYIFEKNQLSKKEKLEKEAPMLAADAIWFAFEAMNEVERPTTEGDWERFQSSRRVAWKTGTSFGFRDAWAVGATPRYAVGVWAGNADGEGRPGLAGVHSAAPLMFDIFDQLPSTAWFDPPFDEMKKVAVCRQSGYLALDICEKDTIWSPGSGLNAPPCPFHQLVHLDKTRCWQVSSECEQPGSMVSAPWFVLPPLEEFYFKTQNPNYKPLPPFRKDCGQGSAQAERPMQLIYPKNPTKIYVPVDLDGKLSRTVFKVAHRLPETTIHWHLDSEYIGSTANFHDKELNPSPGRHTLTVLDEKGNRLEQVFEILVKR